MIVMFSTWTALYRPAVVLSLVLVPSLASAQPAQPPQVTLPSVTVTAQKEPADPQTLPVSLTLVLIRVIEAFKIVDLPNVLTNGGPGIATESLTLHAFMAWRTLDLGGSAAIAYMLLFMVTFFCTAYVNLTRQRAGS